eukprot:COSAG06_NODE_577_length_14043_cov_5.505952_4_plen_49_part_00
MHGARFSAFERLLRGRDALVLELVLEDVGLPAPELDTLQLSTPRLTTT